MKLALWIVVFLMGPFSFAEIGPLQAEQLANRCQSYQYFLTGPNMNQEARDLVQNLLYKSKKFVVIKDDDIQRRFFLIVFRLSPTVKQKQQLVDGLGEILSVKNSELSCSGSVGMPGL